MHYFYICIFVYLSAFLVYCLDEPLLTIKNGQIRGTINQTVEGNKTYYAFRGIPFGKPPLGALRFKSPEKVMNWTETLNATKDGNRCVQDAFGVTGSEDCLYVNVYTPSITDKNFAVMVWIHGGGFFAGSSAYSDNGPDYLLDQDVIFVSFNYRLGIFGFLSTEDLSCPGNWGLKDQVLALNWIQENIYYFGGDPRKITLFGQSAGGASIAYLLQSRQTEGLFRAAIMESGTSLSLWTLSRGSKSLAFRIGETLKVDTTNSSTLVDGLRNVDYRRLQDVSSILGYQKFGDNPFSGLSFAPVKEPYHENAVFDARSYELFSSGNFHRVPVLMGVNSNEATGIGDTIRPNSIIILLLQLYLFARHDLNTTILAPIDLTSDGSKKSAAGTLINSYYFRNEIIGRDPSALSQFVSDDIFNRAGREQALQQSKYVDVYYYVFSYEGKLGSTANRTEKVLNRGLIIIGVGHGEELRYLFRSYPTFEPSYSDILTRARMVKLWTNFAKFCNPTPIQDTLLQNREWTVATSNRSNLVYLDIGANLELRTNPFKANMKFYDFVYKYFGDLQRHDTY